MDTVRTTIRIRKDLLDQSKRLALERNTSLQQIVNDVLAKGFSEESYLKRREEVFATIESLRKSLKGKHDVNKLVEENKRELQERTDRILGLHKRRKS